MTPRQRPPPPPSTPPPPPPPCAFEITGPKFIGILGGATFSAAAGGDVEWKILAGSQFIDPDNTIPFPDGVSSNAAISLKARNTPGTITIEARFTVEGAECVRMHTLNVVQYDEINLRYRAFIPCEAIHAPQDPFGWILPFEFYGGDNRTFNYNASSFRASFDINIRVSDFPDEDGVMVLPNSGPAFGATTAYDANGAQLVAGACNVALLGPPPVAAVTLSANPNNHQTLWGRFGPNRIVLRFGLNAGNPLVPVACVIGARLFVDITQTVDPDTGEQKTRYNLFSIPDPLLQHSDGHSAFPAHEFYIQSGGIVTDLIRYDPIPLGGTVLWLCPPLAVPISYSPTSTPPRNIEGEIVTSAP